MSDVLLLGMLIAVAAVPAYLLGSVNGAIIASQVIYRKDIRKFGSKNPGLTNFFRVFGKSGALLVVLIDVVKSISPVIFGGWLIWWYFPDLAISEAWLFSSFFEVSLFGMLATGFFVVLGHSFPVFYGFKGGRGVMAVGTILFAVDWRLALVGWGVFILMILLTRYVSLGSVLGAATLPFTQLYLFGLGGYLEFITTLATVTLLIVRHQANIKRLLKGEESKISFRKKQP